MVSILDFDLFSYAVDVCEDVLHPTAVFSDDFKAGADTLTRPVFDVLAEVAHLTSD